MRRNASVPDRGYGPSVSCSKCSESRSLSWQKYSRIFPPRHRGPVPIHDHGQVHGAAPPGGFHSPCPEPDSGCPCCPRTGPAGKPNAKSQAAHRMALRNLREVRIARPGGHASPLRRRPSRASERDYPIRTYLASPQIITAAPGHRPTPNLEVVPSLIVSRPPPPGGRESRRRRTDCPVAPPLYDSPGRSR